jgi:hypothetical protein
MVEENDLTTKLFKLAGYSNISATFMLNAKDSDKKMYLAIHISRFRIVGMLDSGSDLTLMHKSLFDKLKIKNFKDFKFIKGMVVKSFSNNDIQILGNFQFLIKLIETLPGISILIHVIPNIPNTPQFLLGNNFLKAGLAHIGYTGDIKNPKASIYFRYPVEYTGDIIYERPVDVFLCEGVCDIEPYCQANVEFTLCAAAPVIRTDIILITALYIDTIGIIPSRTEITYSHVLGAYTATARIINLSGKRQLKQLVGRFELINSYETVPLENKNYVT